MNAINSSLDHISISNFDAQNLSGFYSFIFTGSSLTIFKLDLYNVTCECVPFIGAINGPIIISNVTINQSSMTNVFLFPLDNSIVGISNVILIDYLNQLVYTQGSSVFTLENLFHIASNPITRTSILIKLSPGSDNTCAVTLYQFMLRDFYGRLVDLQSGDKFLTRIIFNEIVIQVI